MLAATAVRLLPCQPEAPLASAPAPTAITAACTEEFLRPDRVVADRESGGRDQTSAFWRDRHHDQRPAFHRRAKTIREPKINAAIREMTVSDRRPPAGPLRRALSAQSGSPPRSPVRGSSRSSSPMLPNLIRVRSLAKACSLGDCRESPLDLRIMRRRVVALSIASSPSLRTICPIRPQSFVVAFMCGGYGVRGRRLGRAGSVAWRGRANLAKRQCGPVRRAMKLR
jgi:hypothetical protein